MPVVAADKVMRRFWKKVYKDGPLLSHVAHLGQCWMWTASRLSGGYGQFVYSRKAPRTSAHRHCWIMRYGSIPEGMFVLHRCDNPSCVRPSHLFLGTPLANMQDMYGKRRAKHLPAPGEENGNHKLTEDNVREIRRRFIPRCRKNGRKALALEFGVTEMMIYYIITRQNWSHI